MIMLFLKLVPLKPDPVTAIYDRHSSDAEKKHAARKLHSDFKKELGVRRKDLIYSPQDKAILGRANRDKQCFFYCSLAKEPIFFELADLQNGDEQIVTFWKSTEKMIVNNIGYTQKLFEQLVAKKTCPTWIIYSHVHKYHPTQRVVDF